MVVFFEHVLSRIPRDKSRVAVVVFVEAMVAGFDRTSPLAAPLHRQETVVHAEIVQEHGFATVQK